MSLANIIALVTTYNADPSTQPEHNVEPMVTETVVGRNLPKPERKSKVQAAPIHNPNEGKSMTPGLTMPERNTLDAQGFLNALRNAGKRKTEEGKPFHDKREERNDIICAIHAYIGYDNRRDFGSQEQEARSKAQRELRGEKFTGPSREELRAASKSAAGFVHGMPKPSQRILLDLQARERSVAEAMIDAKTEEEKAQHRMVLDQIRQAISELIG